VIKQERGYTLVELLITLAISGIIFTAVGSAIYQMSTVSGMGNDKLTANHELQNTAYWFNLDGQSALRAKAGSGLTYYLADDRIISYALNGTDLLRTDGSAQMTLARNISSASFSVKERLVALNITSSFSGRSNISEQRNYQVYLRSIGP
jgi:prepilin-type N-terminal cleavage/methylation domain-containing protein